MVEFVFSYDVTDQFRIKLGSIEGNLEKFCYQLNIYEETDKAMEPTYFITTQLFSHSRGICPARKASYKPNLQITAWNEWIVFPLRICELLPDTTAVFFLYKIGNFNKEILVSWFLINLFEEHSCLKNGVFDLVGQTEVFDPTKLFVSYKEVSKFDRIGKLLTKFNNDEMFRLDWVDKIILPKMESKISEMKINSGHIYLNIKIPHIQSKNSLYPVIYCEVNKPLFPLKTNDRNSFGGKMFSDPNLGTDSPIDKMHIAVALTIRSEDSARAHQPTQKIKEKLKEILAAFPLTPIMPKEIKLIIKYRHYLKSNTNALIKVLRWSHKLEDSKAIQLMQCWTLSPLDSLSLFKFKNSVIRRYAVWRLKRISNTDLTFYLLPLVHSFPKEDANQVIDEAYGDLESHDYTPPELSSMSWLADDMTSFMKADEENEVFNERIAYEGTNLMRFLFHRASRDVIVASYLHWYFEQESSSALFRSLSKMLDISLSMNAGLNCQISVINLQSTFVDDLYKLICKVYETETGRDDRTKALNNQIDNIFYESDVPLPLDPTVRFHKFVPEVRLFKSKLMPALFTIETSTRNHYKFIVKVGDDVRQDQFMLQIISLMDKILRDDNLDLELITYKVIAINKKYGFIEFIKSKTIGAVLTEYQTISNFMNRCVSESSNGITSQQIMENYLKSCAGYSIITHILGVGDRHLDNLMLTDEGRMFHIDFGYIFGNDPKPMPPQMKITKEMVDTMIGDNYGKFLDYCYTAFVCLRRNAHTIMNAIELFADSEITSIPNALKLVQENMCLYKTDNEMAEHIRTIVVQSMTAIFPIVSDIVHKFSINMMK